MKNLERKFKSKGQCACQCEIGKTLLLEVPYLADSVRTISYELRSKGAL